MAPPPPQHQDDVTLWELANQSIPLLFKVKSVFPFDFFPDTLLVDYNKITIIHKEFFFIEQTVNADVSDILNVEVDTTPFFASLKITTRALTAPPLRISFLRKKDGRKARQIINGLLAAHANNAEVGEKNPERIVEMLLALGTRQ